MSDANGSDREVSKPAVTETEKHHDISSKALQLHEYKESEGYVVDAEEAGAGGVKLAKDGRTRLIPQPSEDAQDPLNWTWRQKHIMLFIICITAFLPDFGSATGAVTLLAQAAEWDMTPDEVNHSQAGNVFMLGAGGVIVVILSAYFGRLPVVFWFLVGATATAAWCAGASSFPSFMAARILNGFFSTVSQSGGLMFIQDMFFFHERARKINVLASFIVLSPYLGPFLAAFETETKPWPTPFWVYTAMTALGLVLTALFLKETYYDRTLPSEQQPSTGNRLTSVTGIAQWKSRHLRNTAGQAIMRSLRVIMKPIMVLVCLFYTLTFAWAVGINTTLSIFLGPQYGFGLKQIGFFYFTPIVAVILGEVTGHWLHDLLAKQYIRTHKGHFEPEVRLRAIFFAMPFMIIGLVLVGQSLENNWHYMACSVSWGMYVFSAMVTTVAVSSYALDSYPEASGEVSAWLNFARTLGGFIISYEQIRWATDQGTKRSFGIQGAICAIAFLFVLMLMWKGKKLRLWSGPLNFTTV